MNEEAQLAWQIVETTDTSLFLTGRAGTGKTTFLRNLKERTSKCAVVVAPTGIAALNAGGVTMHSFFQLPFAPYVPGTKFGSQGSQVRMSREKKRVICSIDLLVIDAWCVPMCSIRLITCCGSAVTATNRSVACSCS